MGSVSDQLPVYKNGNMLTNRPLIVEDISPQLGPRVKDLCQGIWQRCRFHLNRWGVDMALKMRCKLDLNHS